MSTGHQPQGPRTTRYHSPGPEQPPHLRYDVYPYGLIYPESNPFFYGANNSRINSRNIVGMDEDYEVMRRLALSSADLLSSGKYSDMTLKCGGRTFKVHRAIICTKSSFFAAAMDSGFKESFDREINLEEDEPYIIEKMLQCLYSGKYDDSFGELCESLRLGSNPSGGLSARPTDFKHPLILATELYILADKYDIQVLKRYCKKRYKEVVRRFWQSPEYMESVALLYEKTLDVDRLGLRYIMAAAAEVNIYVLIKKEGLKEKFIQLLCDQTEFAMDVGSLYEGTEDESDPDYAQVMTILNEAIYGFETNLEQTASNDDDKKLKMNGEGETDQKTPEPEQDSDDGNEPESNTTEIRDEEDLYTLEDEIAVEWNVRAE